MTQTLRSGIKTPLKDIEAALFNNNGEMQLNIKGLKINIMGNIGSGKSTLINLIKLKYGKFIQTYPEPMDLWLWYLNFMTNNKDKNMIAFFQCIVNRWFYTIKHVELPKCKTSAVLIERSATEAKFVFMKYYEDKQIFNDMELKWLNYNYEENKMDYDLHIFVNTSVETCISRKNSRGRICEKLSVKEELEYWNVLHNNYVALLHELKQQGKNVYYINGELDETKVFKQFEEILLQHNVYVSKQLKVVKLTKNKINNK